MSKKVLLADDSVTIQRVVKIILADGDYALQVADNGEAAFDKAQVDRPDIVLADVYMPGKNGYELCAAIKQEPTLAGVPVLLLSGTFEAFDESKALAAGADGWIAKPFESLALIEQIDGVLARSATVTAFPATAVEIDEAPAVAAAEPDMWASLEMDTLATEDSEESLADETAEVVDAFDEVELEADDLWDDEPLLDQDENNLELAEEQDEQVGELDFAEIDAVNSSSTELAPSAALAESPEEEVLFLDESDLLIEDVGDSGTDIEADFEFITQQESSPQELVEEPVETLADNALVVDEFPEPAMVVEEEITAEEENTAEVQEEPESAVEPILGADLDTIPEPEQEPVVEKVASAVSGLSFFSNSSLIAKIAGTHETEPVSELAAVCTAELEPQGMPLSKEDVVGRVQGLSEEDLTAIVEQVAGKVIERLAATMLERIAWEVVPDLAESLIKEEISRITAEQD
ncbi:MAG: response regulator [Desulfuromonadaceae bacterium]|nr:response regulator [Desulfuromonadaceae bacterium]